MNSNIEIEDPFLSSPQFNSPLPLFQSRKANSNESCSDYDLNNQCLNLMNPSVSRFDETLPNEYNINFDIFGNAIKYRSEPCLPSTYGSRHEIEQEQSTVKKLDGILTSLNFNGGEDNDDRDSEYSVEKENRDPFGNLITPLKPKRKLVGAGTGSLGSRTYSGRSPLQDITPPLGKKRAENYSSKIERTLRYSGTPKTGSHGHISEQKSLSKIQHLR